MAVLFLRRDLPEPPKGEEVLEELPLKVALRDHWRDLLRVGGLYLAVNSGFYLIFVYTISYLTEKMKIAQAAVMDINLACVAVTTFLPALFGHLSDRIGRKPILLSGTLGIILLSYPLFWLMSHSAITMVLAGQFGFALLFAWILGANPVTQVEAAPARVRASILTISTNVSMAVFGGTMPLVATYLVQRTGDDFSPVFYLMALGALTLIAVLSLPETRGKSLR